MPRRLKPLALWLRLSPWIVAACSLCLAVLVLGLGLRSARQATDFTESLLLEKGAALVAALEGTLRSGVDFGWTDAELQDVLNRIAAQPGVRFMLLADADGQVVAASAWTENAAAPLNSETGAASTSPASPASIPPAPGLAAGAAAGQSPSPAGAALPSPDLAVRLLSQLAPSATPHWKLTTQPERLVVVYRTVTVPVLDSQSALGPSDGDPRRAPDVVDQRGMGFGRGRGYGRGMGMGYGRGMGMTQGEHGGGHGHRGWNRLREASLVPGQTLTALVACDPAPLDLAREQDDSHEYIIAAVLAILALGAALSSQLIQAYRTSRAVAQEATALAGAVVDTLPVGIVVTDPQGHIRSMNPEARRLCGLVPGALPPLAELLPGVAAALHPLQRAGAGAELGTARAGEAKEGGPARLVEHEVRCLIAGKMTPLALSASRIVTEDGQDLGVAMIVRDLGELRQLQAELRRTERLAALGRMASGIAHEIRNPLGAIKGLARWLEEGFADNGTSDMTSAAAPADPSFLQPAASADVASAVPPELRRELCQLGTILTEEVLRLDRVVGDLLELARPDTLDLRPTPIGLLADRTLRLLEGDLAALHIACVRHLPEPERPLLLDADRLTQVLLNLGINAIQSIEAARLADPAAESRQDELRFEGRLEGDFYVLEIADSGEGMSPETLRQAGTPYFTTKARGTGLGLSIAHKLAEAHGGRLELENRSCRGLVARLWLPLAHSNGEAPLIVDEIGGGTQ